MDLLLETPSESASAAPASATWTVLCVDDEPNILSALRRLLRGAGSYRMLSAPDGPSALALLEAEEVDLVLSDMQMPGMDGAELLEQVRQRWPETERLLLTGHADLRSTLAAINRGEVYRYITKPWSDEELLLTLRQACERRQLKRDKQHLEALTQQQNRALQELNTELEAKVQARTAELSDTHEKLKRNYLNAIKAFSNLLELRGGPLAGHARKVAELARRTAKTMGLSDAQQQEVFVAGLLHDIGHIGLSDKVLTTPVIRLPAPELALYRRHPVLGEQALLALDDMQSVASLIRWHHERFDGKGYPDGLQAAAIPRGAAILAVVDAFEDLQSGHLNGRRMTVPEAQTQLARGRGNQFDPEVLDAFLKLIGAPQPAGGPPLSLRTSALQAGMVLAKGLVSGDGVMLLAADFVLTDELIRRIRAYEARDGLTLTLRIKREG